MAEKPTKPAPMGYSFQRRKDVKTAWDHGPWTVSEDGRVIQSDDFTHDVALTVSGDFASNADRRAYSEELAKRLNGVGDSSAVCSVYDSERNVPSKENL